MRALLRTLFVAYVLILLWLVLFKFSYEPLAVIRDFQKRTLNLMPFAYARRSEMLANVVAFIPFGVMLSATMKRARPIKTIAAICAFSVAVEYTQYALAIGAADITDVIMNTCGGALGLAAYAGLATLTGERALNRGILIVGTLMLLALLYLRVFVFMVRY